jgi:hypothetical protein
MCTEDAVAHQHRERQGGVQAGLDHDTDSGKIFITPKVVDNDRPARLKHHAKNRAAGNRPVLKCQQAAGLDAVGGGKKADRLTLGVVKVNRQTVECKMLV